MCNVHRMLSGFVFSHACSFYLCFRFAFSLFLVAFLSLYLFLSYSLYLNVWFKVLVSRARHFVVKIPTMCKTAAERTETYRHMQNDNLFGWCYFNEVFFFSRPISTIFTKWFIAVAAAAVASAYLFKAFTRARVCYDCKSVWWDVLTSCTHWCN